MTTYLLNKLSDTKKLADYFAKNLANYPSVMLLQGELGAGKTTFMRYYLRSLGHKEAVISPTYNLIQVYNFPFGELWHVDAYRLQSHLDAIEIGLADALLQHNCCIEWPERITAILPPHYHILYFKNAPDNRTLEHFVY